MITIEFCHFLQSVFLDREPTIDELYKETHQHRHKEKKGSWVCKRSEKSWYILLFPNIIVVTLIVQYILYILRYPLIYTYTLVNC